MKVVSNSKHGQVAHSPSTLFIRRLPSNLNIFTVKYKFFGCYTLQKVK